MGNAMPRGARAPLRPLQGPRLGIHNLPIQLGHSCTRLLAVEGLMARMQACINHRGLDSAPCRFRCGDDRNAGPQVLEQHYPAGKGAGWVRAGMGQPRRRLPCTPALPLLGSSLCSGGACCGGGLPNTLVCEKGAF